MPVRTVDDKASDTLVVVSGEGFWTGSSTLPHLHQITLPSAVPRAGAAAGRGRLGCRDSRHISHPVATSPQPSMPILDDARGVPLDRPSFPGPRLAMDPTRQATAPIALTETEKQLRLASDNFLTRIDRLHALEEQK